MHFKINLFNWWLTWTIVLDFDILWDHCCMWKKCVLRYFMHFKINLFNWWLTWTIVLDYDILWDHCCMWKKCVLRYFMHFKINLFNCWLTWTIVLDYDILWDHCCMWNKCVLRHLWYILKEKDNYSIKKNKIKDLMRCLVPPKKSPNIFNQRRRVYFSIQRRDIMLHTFDWLILIWLMTYTKHHLLCIDTL